MHRRLQKVQISCDNHRTGRASAARPTTRTILITIYRCYLKLSTKPSTEVTFTGRRLIHVRVLTHQIPWSSPTSPSCPGAYPPRPEQAQTSQKASEFEPHDSSGPLFSMYLELAEEEDLTIAERWRADARSILVFVSPHIQSCTTRLYALTGVHRRVCSPLPLQR